MQALKGSLVALVTPLSSDGEVDYTALKGLVEWHIEQGTHGIVSVGTTGEAPTLSVNEHSKVIAKTVEYVNARVPVIAGTGGNPKRDSIALTKHAKEVGADFCLLVTPYYNKPNQEGLLRHFLSIAESVDIPQILYNVPSRTACDILPSTVKILANHKNIVGIKEALDKGFEGLMIKPNSSYYESKRSHAWLKIKPFIEVTLKVVDIQEGSGKHAGKLGAFQVEGDDDGKFFSLSVGSGLTDDDREKFWSAKDKLIGRMVEIRADAITQSIEGEHFSLRFPRFKNFRGFKEDEKI